MLPHLCFSKEGAYYQHALMSLLLTWIKREWDGFAAPIEVLKTPEQSRSTSTPMRAAGVMEPRNVRRQNA